MNLVSHLREQRHGTMEQHEGGTVEQILNFSLHSFSPSLPVHYFLISRISFSDPGCLSSIFHVFLGFQGGQIVLSFPGHKQRVIRFLGWAVVTGLLGLGLCGASLNSGPIPINKNLWYVYSFLSHFGIVFGSIVRGTFIPDHFRLEEANVRQLR